MTNIKFLPLTILAVLMIAFAGCTATPVEDTVEPVVVDEPEVEVEEVAVVSGSFAEILETFRDHLLPGELPSGTTQVATGFFDDCTSNPDGPCGYSFSVSAASGWDWNLDEPQTYYITVSGGAVDTTYGPFVSNLINRSEELRAIDNMSNVRTF